MTDLPDTFSTSSPAVTPHRPAARDQGYRIEEAYWGYRIVPVGPQPIRLVVLQTVATISGASFLAAAATLALAAGRHDLLFRGPVMLVLVALGLAMLWFASRGALVQVEVDTINAEVREIVRNRTGAVSVLARYGFDCIGSVFIQRAPETAPTLVLRYRNTARTMIVASGSEATLARLRDRLGRDLIVGRDVA